MVTASNPISLWRSTSSFLSLSWPVKVCRTSQLALQAYAQGTRVSCWCAKDARRRYSPTPISLDAQKLGSARITLPCSSSLYSRLCITFLAHPPSQTYSFMSFPSSPNTWFTVTSELALNLIQSKVITQSSVAALHPGVAAPRMTHR